MIRFVRRPKSVTCRRAKQDRWSKASDRRTPRQRMRDVERAGDAAEEISDE